MATKTKTVTLRLPEDMIQYLTRNGDSINQAVFKEISYLKRIRQVTVGELKGIFDPAEWLFIADVFNGVQKDDVFCANKGAFVAACEEAEHIEDRATKLGVNIDVLTAKISKLSGANIEAIYDRVNDYWCHHQEIDLNSWAKF